MLNYIEHLAIGLNLGPSALLGRPLSALLGSNDRESSGGLSTSENRSALFRNRGIFSQPRTNPDDRTANRHRLQRL